MLKVTAFFALIYLCVSVRIPESGRTPVLIYFCVYFKSAWCLAEMLHRWTFRDRCFERCTVVTIPDGLGLDCRNMPAEMKPQRLKSPLPHYHPKITRRGICTLPGTKCALCKGDRETAHVHSNSWKPLPFPQSLMMNLPLAPFLPSGRR